ncbi:hypothetical protein ACTXT7_000197 [Hymenolepis weldensis]
MPMETDFVLDTGGNDEAPKSSGILYNASETALKDDDSNSEPREKPKPQQNFRRVGSSIRYHENDKFSKIKPGHLSYDLRKALGISRQDIPLHVYRMRSLGYPPGWLRKAKVEQLPSFDDGKHNQSRYDSYNEDALIAFPGFNVYSSNLVDRCYEFNCPRIRSADLLENFIESLNKSSDKTGDLSLFKQSLENKGLTDLELERQRILSEMKALSAEASVYLVNKVSQSENEVIDLTKDPEPVADVSSPSSTPEIPIDSSPRANSPKVDSSSEDQTINLDPDEIFTNGNGSIKVDTIKYQVISVDPNEQVLNDTEMTSGDPPTHHVGLLSVAATALPTVNTLSNLPSSANTDDVSSHSTQTTTKLPSLEAFSSGIQPYVPFENLPNTQGGYNRVRNILKRIKNASGDVSLFFEETNSILSKSQEPERSSSQSRSSGSGISSRDGRSSLSRTRRISPSKSDHRSPKSTNRNVDRSSGGSSYHYSQSRSHGYESSRTSNSGYRGGYQNVPSRKYDQRGNFCGTPYLPAIPYRGSSGYDHARGPYSREPPFHGHYSGHRIAVAICLEPVNPRPQSKNAPKNRPSRRLDDKPMTADEINDFLAHSDGESGAGSDWDDVKDEEEVEEEKNVAQVQESVGKSQINIEALDPSSSQLFPKTVMKDIGVAKLFETAPVPVTNDENILGYSDALNEYGQKIHDTLLEVAADRYEKRVEREVEKVILVSEQPSIYSTGDDLSAAKLKALKVCDEKRAKALTALGGPKVATSKGGYFVATPTNIRVAQPQISSEIWETRTSNRRVFSLIQYAREASGPNAANLQTETTVLVAIVGSKMPPRRSRNNKIFSIWRLTDLTTVGTGSSTGPNVSLFLFGACHEKLWKQPEGTVIAILKPKILPPSENDKYAGNGMVDVSITVDSAPFVMLLGMSPDLAHCAGTTKAGNPCSRIVNKNACKYCDFHVKSAYISASHNRAGFATRSISKPEIGQGRGAYMSSHASSVAMSQSGFSLQLPLTMPTSRSRDTSLQGQNVKSSRVSLNISKLNSAGYKVDSSTVTLTTTSNNPNASTSLSKPEEAFVSSLTRPSRGSLNLLRHLEGAHKSGSDPLGTARRPSIIPVPLLKPKSDETFATFFKGAKKKLATEPKPQLGKGLQATFIDLGPVPIQPGASTSLQSLPSFRSPLNAARQRAVSLVKARGGIDGMLQADKEKTRKRISEVVEKSMVKKARLSPLDQILGSASGSKENLDPMPQKTPEASQKVPSFYERIKKKREELAKLVSQGSGHSELAVANEDNASKRMLSRLEARDQIEEKLLNQHEQECQIVTCLDCPYRSMRVGKNCRKEGHKLEFSTGIRRFFACRNCKARTVTLDRYPNFECINCGESLFEKDCAIAKRKGPKLAGEKLVIRGIEEKFLS